MQFMYLMYVMCLMYNFCMHFCMYFCMYSISSEKHSQSKCGNYLNISVCTIFVNKQIFEINEPLSVYLLNRPFVELSSISRPLQVQCLLGIIFTYNYFSIFICNIHLFISINREKTSKFAITPNQFLIGTYLQLPYSCFMMQIPVLGDYPST